jgi:exonuclease SbcC
MMLKNIEIKNFQSHKNTEIEFDSGINVITGPSDQGKSAILRALLWLVTNRPLGTDDIVSHWARDEKDKIKESLQVLLETDGGTVKRLRNSEKNSYSLHVSGKKEKLYEAFNKDVPEDITAFLRLFDVNIQQQHDTPFLLSQSPLDVAKYLNKLVHLDIIDSVLANADTKRRAQVQRLKTYEDSKIKYEKRLKEFDWITEAQERNTNLEICLKQQKSYFNSSKELHLQIKEYKSITKKIESMPDMTRAKEIINAIEALKIDYDQKNDLSVKIYNYKQQTRIVKLAKKLSPAKALCEDIKNIDKELSDLSNKKETLEDMIAEYTETKSKMNIKYDKDRALVLIRELEKIKPDYSQQAFLLQQITEYNKAQKKYNEQIANKAELIKQMPKICPVCGSILKDIA